MNSYYNNIARLYPKPDIRGYLYIVVSPTFPEYCKIGKSINLADRIRTYNAYNPYKTFIFDYISVLFDDYTESEDTILEQLKQQGIEPLVGCEWFDIKHIALIKELIQNLDTKHKRLLS